MLGASYFRVIGAGQVYGLSARGLAIDTALPSGEEFPRFKEFWIERPKPTDKRLTIYALLDSPRATGAYKFVVMPGRDTVVDVQSKIYLREKSRQTGGCTVNQYVPVWAEPTVACRSLIVRSCTTLTVCLSMPVMANGSGVR